MLIFRTVPLKISFNEFDEIKDVRPCPFVVGLLLLLKRKMDARKRNTSSKMLGIICKGLWKKMLLVV
jgi:hypothetical protein